ncbi:MAG: hypothetical protein ACXVHS_10750 [Methanobacterium sp.]
MFLQQTAVSAKIKGISEYKGFNTNDVTAIERENALDPFPRLKELI